MKLIKKARHLDDDDCKRVRYVFALESMDRVTDVYETARQLQEWGEIAPYGCNCRICCADGDCCGRFVLSGMKAVLAGDRLVILQRFYQNI